MGIMGQCDICMLWLSFGTSDEQENSHWRNRRSRFKIVSIDLMSHLCEVPDPRQRKVKDRLINILFIGVIAFLCGVDDFVGMAKEFGQAVRGHWGIENQLHWQLAVSYQEDKCRVRQGHADANLAIIRRLTLNMLKANKTEKLGIKTKRLLAGWDMDYCEVVLAG